MEAGERKTERANIRAASYLCSKAYATLKFLPSYLSSQTPTP